MTLDEFVRMNKGFTKSYDNKTKRATLTDTKSGKSINFLSGQGQDYGLGSAASGSNKIVDMDKLMGNFTTNSYESPYAADIASALASLKDYKPYNPDRDKGLKAAQEEAMNSVSRIGASKGMLYSDSNKAAMGKAALSLIPQFQSAYEQQQQNMINSTLQKLSALTGLDNQAYGRYQDNLTATQNAETQARNEWLSNIGQFAENYQLEINNLTNDGDPSNDWQIPYLKTARQDKIAGMNSAQASAEESAYKKAFDMWKATGTASPEIAKILGVPSGARTADYNINLMQENRLGRNASSGNPDDITSLGTSEQVSQFYNQLNAYTGKGSGLISKTIAADPQKAIPMLMQNKEQIVNEIGQALYNKLVKDVQGYKPSSVKSTDYKTDPDFATNVQWITENPDIALDEIKKNSAQLIKDYGVDGYNYLVKKATPEE